MQDCYALVHIVVDNGSSIGAFFEFSSPVRKVFGSTENLVDTDRAILNQLSPFLSTGSDAATFQGGSHATLNPITRRFSENGRSLTVPAIPRAAKEFFLYITFDEIPAHPLVVTASLLEDFIQEREIET